VRSRACACANFYAGDTAALIRKIGIAATGAGLVVDAAAGAARIAGKAVGAAAEAVTPGAASK
jgi:hypothetical protein